MNNMKFTLKSIIWMYLLCVSAPLLAEPGPENSESPLASLQSAVSGTPTLSSITCYFNNKGEITWRWGLKSNYAYYYITGDWMKTKYTKLEKFNTSASFDDIHLACMNAKVYYKESGELFAIFTAKNRIGYNYTILPGGNELFPEY